MREKTIYALGFFDGVHAGHQALLKQCRLLADQHCCRAGVVTFLGHPDTLVSGVTPPLINTPEDRKRLLMQFQMDTVVELPFDRKMMTMPWQDFFQLLIGRYGAAGMVCGDDFRFGDGGEGSADKLRSACRHRELPCVVVPEQIADGVRISSTYIRHLLEQGQMEKANRFLSHPHVLTGRVIRGQQLGRTIGIPTANLQIPEGVLVPRFGVYCCRAVADGRIFPAVTNVGVRPTVDGHNVTVEPWLLDFQGDLYGRELTLEFYAYLREEKKFNSLQELQAEIRKNALQTREILKKYESYPLHLGKLMI